MFSKLITGFTLAAVLAGCATSTPRAQHEDATQSGILEALNEASLPAVAPREVEAALLPDVGVEIPDLASGADRFDVNTDETPARAFFMALVEGTPYNMVVHPDVSGNISLAMKSVTVTEVLDVISEVYGYAYRESRTGFIVLPATLQSRIFQIDYLNLQRSGISRTRVSSGGQVSESSSQGGQSQGGQQAFSSVSGSGSQGGRNQQQLSK